MSGNAYSAPAMTAITARNGANSHLQPMQLGLDFLSSTASLSLDFLSAGLARASLKNQFLAVGLSIALSFTAASTAVSGPSLTLNFLAPAQGNLPSLTSDFVAQTYSAGTIDPGSYEAGVPNALPPGLFLSGSSQGQYQAGYQPPGTYQAEPPVNGSYSLGGYVLPLATELNLNFLAYQSPGDPLAYAGLNLSLDFLDSGPYIARGVLNYPTMMMSFLGQSYAAGAPTTPPSGTPLLPDPPLSIGFVTPGTDTDARLSYAVLGDTLV
jgi:hypothetical protein